MKYIKCVVIVMNEHLSMTYDERHLEVLHVFWTLDKTIDGSDEDVAIRAVAAVEGLEAVVAADADGRDKLPIESQPVPVPLHRFVEHHSALVAVQIGANPEYI